MEKHRLSIWNPEFFAKHSRDPRAKTLTARVCKTLEPLRRAVRANDWPLVEELDEEFSPTALEAVLEPRKNQVFFRLRSPIPKPVWMSNSVYQESARGKTMMIKLAASLSNRPAFGDRPDPWLDVEFSGNLSGAGVVCPVKTAILARIGRLVPSLMDEKYEPITSKLTQFYLDLLCVYLSAAITGDEGKLKQAEPLVKQGLKVLPLGLVDRSNHFVHLLG